MFISDVIVWHSEDNFAHAKRILAPVANLELWSRRIENLKQARVYHVLRKLRSYNFYRLEDLKCPHLKSPLKTPSGYTCSVISHWSCLKGSTALRIRIIFLMFETFSLWCSQLFKNLWNGASVCCKLRAYVHQWQEPEQYHTFYELLISM